MIVPALALATMLATASVTPPVADSLTAAKELYASAAYDDALAMLTRLSSTSETPNAEQIEEYQSLCLYALGRTADAESAIRDLIRHDPFFHLDGDDASPRVRTLFADVRKQLLPQIAKDRYLTAKAELEAKQYTAAESHLDQVHKIIDEAHGLGVSDGSLDDLGTLVDGFRELASAELAKAAAPSPAAATTATAPSTSAPKSTPTRSLFDVTDTDVTPPVSINQAVPPVPREFSFALQDRKGVLALTIAADGHVEEAAMREPFKSPYDQMVLSAARTWRYKPAMKNGAPVRYALIIELTYKSSH